MCLYEHSCAGVCECSFRKKEGKGKEKEVSNMKKVHLAQELDDVHARPSFVFPGQLAELHSL